MAKPLTIDDLERMAAQGCQAPGCDHSTHDDGDGQLFIHGRCHVGAPTWASYTPGSGVLRIVCARCRKPIVEVQVAP